VLHGCTVHKVGTEYPAGVDLPLEYSVPGDGADLGGRWWEAFGDEGLNRTVATALDANATLQQAWARLEQAKAVASQARSQLYPEVAAAAEASRSRTSVNIGGEFGERDVTSDLYGISIGAGYEIDLWGKIRSLEGAAAAGARASRQDLDTVAMTLAATVAETWFTIAEQQEQVDLLHQQVAVGETFLQLVEMRFSLGQAAALDVYQQRQQLAATESQLPLAEARLALARNLMAALLGRPAGEALAEDPGPLPRLSPFPGAGAPADLLQARPDIRAAFERIRVADHRLGAAVADRYPAVRLTARTGYQWRELASVFDTWIYQLAAGLTAPVYDGKRREEEVKRRQAVVTEMLESYRRTILEALREVEDALAVEMRQGEYLSDVARQVRLAEATLERSRVRYGRGLSDYLPVTSALLALQRLERSELSARREAISNRIQLHRALGGTWTDDLVPPAETGLSQDKGDNP
jgi:NodT family efflux transporter outer membrane factor (OMF) lipoprotein